MRSMRKTRSIRKNDKFTPPADEIALTSMSMTPATTTNPSSLLNGVDQYSFIPNAKFFMANSMQKYEK